MNKDEKDENVMEDIAKFAKYDNPNNSSNINPLLTVF